MTVPQVSAEASRDGGLSPGSSGELLQASFAVAIGVVVLGLACLGLWPWATWAPWLAAGGVVFGLFLGLQTALLRPVDENPAFLLVSKAGLSSPLSCGPLLRIRPTSLLPLP